jgi:hypothetical protein
MLVPKKTIILIAVILILVAGNVYFGLNYFLVSKEVKEVREDLKKQQLNTKIINFSRLFVEKVLKAEKDISFEERLGLENAVRDLNDKEILSQWEKFTESKTESEAQENVKNLLDVLTKKFSY